MDRDKRRFELEQEEVLSRRWGTLTQYDILYHKEDGTRETQRREVYDNKGDGVCVLLYDPVARMVILTKQFRIPLGLRDEMDGMSIEVPAGKIDNDEDMDDAIKREVLEETGYQLSTVQYLFAGYSSPGSLREKVHFFSAEIEVNNQVASGGGQQDEQEEIEVMKLSYEEVIELLRSGSILDLKTIVMLQYFVLHIRS